VAVSAFATCALVTMSPLDATMKPVARRLRGRVDTDDRGLDLREDRANVARLRQRGRRTDRRRFGSETGRHDRGRPMIVGRGDDSAGDAPADERADQRRDQRDQGDPIPRRFAFRFERNGGLVRRRLRYVVR
jgi:hypothetical protein